MLKSIFKILFWSFVAWLVVRTFIFQTFRIPSASMYGSLFEGDFVVINKMAFGARLPITPLALKLKGKKKYIEGIQLPYFRFFGYSAIQRNDVLAFNYSLLQEEPTDMQEEFIKRCVALPGDTLRIKNGDVYVNATLLTNSHVYNVYTVTAKTIPDTLALKKAGIITDHLFEDKKSGVFLMTAMAADSLSKLSTVTSVVIDRFKPDYYNPSVYPHLPEFPWNYDYFGPLWIPGKGDSILVNRQNLIVYQHCIERYENERVVVKQDSIYISGKPLLYYTFKQNYYFVLGDNRHNSVDSRVMGLLPEDHIIGKASYILYSSQQPSRKFLQIQ